MESIKKISTNKFRKRSFSLKKITSQKELAVKAVPSSPKVANIKVNTFHSKEANINQNTEDIRKKFSPVDVNKFGAKARLKKKALRLSPK